MLIMQPLYGELLFNCFLEIMKMSLIDFVKCIFLSSLAELINNFFFVHIIFFVLHLSFYSQTFSFPQLDLSLFFSISLFS